VGSIPIARSINLQILPRTLSNATLTRWLAE
jgi:hypothetical protein